MKTQTKGTAELGTQQMTANFEDMTRPDHDERLYSQMNFANAATGAQNQW